jgi:hypothetical protein
VVVSALRDTAGARPPGGKVGSSDVEVKAAAQYVASITVDRTSAQDCGIREIFISVDGAQVGILGPGESVTHEIPAGPHRIRAHNTLFWKTHDVVLQPAEHARFKAINRAGWGSFGLLMVLGASPLYLTFERVE